MKNIEAIYSQATAKRKIKSEETANKISSFDAKIQKVKDEIKNAELEPMGRLPINAFSLKEKIMYFNGMLDIQDNQYSEKEIKELRNKLEIIVRNLESFSAHLSKMSNSEKIVLKDTLDNLSKEFFSSNENNKEKHFVEKTLDAIEVFSSYQFLNSGK